MSAFIDTLKVIFTILLIVLIATYTFLTREHLIKSIQLIGPFETRNLSTQGKCPAENSSFVIVQPGVGRLGNGIFEYLSMRTFAEEVKAVPVVPEKLFKQLLEAFQPLDIPILEDIVHTCGFTFLTQVKHIII